MESSPVVLITGATGGIGSALAQEFLQAGFLVVLGGRNQEKLASLQASLGGGDRALTMALDVTDAEGVDLGLNGLRQKFGGVDVLVNNAGIAVSAPVAKGQEWAERHMQVNYHGPRRLVEAVLPGMVERGGGRVIQVASSAGLYGYSYTSAYCASKHALIGYTRAAALELKKKRIGFFSICPHFVASPMTEESVQRIQETTGKGEQEARDALAAMNPDGVLVQPEQIAKIAVEQAQANTSGGIVELTGERVLTVEESFEL